MDGQEPMDEGSSPSRRAFLAGAAGLTGVAVASGVWAAPALAQTPSGAPGPTAGARTAPGVVIDLTLDGVAAGPVSSFEGGLPFGPVVNEPVSHDKVVRKHLAAVKYEDILFTSGTGMSKAFYMWIQDTLDNKPSRRAGALTATSQTGAFRRMNFVEALITEIGMPALDAASKDAAKMTIKLAPGVTTRQAGTGGGGASGRIDAKKQKQWLPSNFRLQIDGLDCTKVNKIDALTIKQAVAQDSVGDARFETKEPTHLEIPNLVVSLPETSTQTWNQWLDDFVIKGNNGSDKEKGGALDYNAPDGTALFTLQFTGLGIFKLTPDKVEAGSESIRRVKAEMYCESMKLTQFPT